MIYALLVALIATANLVVGYVAAVRLGWGPPGWEPLMSFLGIGPGRSDQGVEFGSELDLQRLIDFGDQRMRKFRSARIEPQEPLQNGLLRLQVALDRTTLAIETAEARLLAARIKPPGSGWESLGSLVRTDVLEGFERIDEACDAVHQALGARDQHRLLASRTALAAVVRTARPKWATWSVVDDDSADDAIGMLLAIARRTVSELRSAQGPVLGILHDILGENHQVMDWDPGLHRHPAHGLHTLIAYDADRRLNPSDDELQFYVARVGIDQAATNQDDLGGLYFHAFGDRFAERLGQQLPAHWMVAPDGCGDFLIRGEARSMDEFTAELDRIRQRIAKTEVRVGTLKRHLTVSVVVLTDSAACPTEFQLLELQRLLTIVRDYGGNRVYLCDGGAEVLVMPLSETFPEAVLEI